MRGRATQSAGSNTVKVLPCAPCTALDGFDKSAASVAGGVLTQGCLFKCLFHGIEHDISSSYSNFMGGGGGCDVLLTVFRYSTRVCSRPDPEMHDRERDRERWGLNRGRRGVVKFNFSHCSWCLVQLLNRGRLTGALR